MSGVWKFNVKVRRDSCSNVVTLPKEVLQALGCAVGDQVQILWEPGTKRVTMRKRPEPCNAEYWDGKKTHVCGDDDYTHECDHKCREPGCAVSWKRLVEELYVLGPKIPKKVGSGDCGHSCDGCKEVADCSEFTNTHKEGGI